MLRIVRLGLWNRVSTNKIGSRAKQGENPSKLGIIDRETKQFKLANKSNG